MLKSLSYLNIILAILYFITYLLNSFSWTIMAMLLVIVHNGLVIRQLDREEGFRTGHYVLAVLNLVFAGFLGLWLFNVVQSAIEYNYFDNSWIYISITAPFVLSIVAQGLLLFTRRL